MRDSCRPAHRAPKNLLELQFAKKSVANVQTVASGALRPLGPLHIQKQVSGSRPFLAVLCEVSWTPAAAGAAITARNAELHFTEDSEEWPRSADLPLDVERTERTECARRHGLDVRD